MRPVPDPYRVLGLSPGASLDEVKRAYRRLAKQYHPDSAGDAATQRFLVVQSAYESLVSAQGPGRSAPPPGGRPAPGARPTAAGGARSGRRPPGATGDGAAGRPWEADPERSRATRDAYARYRSGRSTDRASGTWRPGARPAGWSDAPSGGAGGPEGTASSGGPGSASASAGPGRASAGGASAGRTSTGGPTAGSDAAGAGRPRGTVRKARLGTTSYDDAEARDPQWHGATWYGQASGTYWTLNPKEYADPRKHGPEYQARGRHAPGSEGGSTPDRGRDPEQGSDPDAGDRPGTAADASTGPEAEGVTGPASPPVGSASAPGTTAAGAGASWTWSQGPGARPVAGGPATMSSAAARGTATGPGRSPTTAAPGWAIRGGSGAPPSSPRDGGDRNDDARPWRELLPDRVVWALVAWPVIGLAAAGSVGQLTGCARFSASCSPGMDLAPILLQPLIIGLLLLLPRLAEVAAVGSVAVVIAAVPGAVLLSATGGSRAPAGEAPAALVAILALAWVVGVAAAVAGRARLPGTGRPSARDRH